MTFDTAIASLKQGEFVMIYDSDGRESEVDLMVAAEFCTPEHVARMRQHAGGLLCLAISNGLAKKLDLEYMHNILANSDDLDSESKNMVMGTAPYGDHPTFSISVNHKRTYTGITDSDRALTIKEMANIYSSDNPKRKLKYTLEIIEIEKKLVGINTLLANKIVLEALKNKKIKSLVGFNKISTEVQFSKKTRFDFLISNNEEKCFLEIKNVTLSREKKIAEFPDAITSRGSLSATKIRPQLSY